MVLLYPCIFLRVTPSIVEDHRDGWNAGSLCLGRACEMLPLRYAAPRYYAAVMVEVEDGLSEMQ